LELISEEEYAKLKEQEGFSDAPFTCGDLGILWADKRIVYTSRVEILGSEIIHEMGHVFADLHHPLSGEGPEEIDFLGWEILVARKVKIPLDSWFYNNRDYCVYMGEIDELKDVEPSNRKEFASHLVEISAKKGLVRREQPIAIR
jgi:hypothetical protein